MSQSELCLSMFRWHCLVHLQDHSCQMILNLMYNSHPFSHYRQVLQEYQVVHFRPHPHALLQHFPHPDAYRYSSLLLGLQ